MARERLAHYRVAGMESPLMKPKVVENTGWSPIAIPSKKAWNGKDRPQAWAGKVFGLVVHTTGRGLPEKAAKAGQYPTIRAVNYYSKSHGCHYVNGYSGHEGGDLIQMAHEDEQANGVGTGDQRKSIIGHGKRSPGGWEKDLPKALVKRWKKRWPGYANPLDLLPGTKTCNSAYIHVECIPLIPRFIDGVHVPADHAEKLLFTYEQHHTVAALACDIALRNQWPDEWWRTPRLLGHEDLTPISRHTKAGGWDPGHLRATPWFDWQLVLELIMVELGITSYCDSDFDKLPKVRKGGPYSKY